MQGWNSSGVGKGPRVPPEAPDPSARVCSWSISIAAASASTTTSLVCRARALSAGHQLAAEGMPC